MGIKLEASRIFGASELFEPLSAFALGLLVLAVSYSTGANLFLAAFAAGITVATLSQSVTQASGETGDGLNQEGF